MVEPTFDDELDLGIEKTPGSRKKLVIIIAAAVLLLALGGAVAWWLFSGDEESGAAEEPAAEAAAEQSEEQPAESEQLPPIYHSLDPVFVVNLPPGGDAKMLQVGVDVLVRSEKLEEFLKHNDPMIRNQLLNLFSSQNSIQLRSRAGKEQLQAKVLAELRKIVKSQGGTGEVEAVYFTSFVMQ
jgi:flagellar FliL protein